MSNVQLLNLSQFCRVAEELKAFLSAENIPLPTHVFFDPNTLQPIDMTNKIYDANHARRVANNSVDEQVKNQVVDVLNRAKIGIETEAGKGNRSCTLMFAEEESIYGQTIEIVQKRLKEIGYTTPRYQYTLTHGKNIAKMLVIAWNGKITDETTST